jgi:NodT family efflux transporter outer membrane factor (OMF) lipoprotein
MRRTATRWIVVAAILMALSACTVGPDYQRAGLHMMPAAYKEAQGWKPSEPRDWESRGAWWTIYNDPVLDQLEEQVDVSNQNLKAAEAAFRQASAIVRVARAGYYPSVAVGATAQRIGAGSQNRSSSRSVSSDGTLTQYDLSATATWVPDIWGRIRRTVESDVALAQVSAADIASARLSAQAALATAYMQLRSDDELKRLLDAAVDAYTQSLAITQNRYAAGIAAESDVVSAQTQLETTRAQAIGVGVQRAQLEHAIAILIGKPPSALAIAPAPLAVDVPTVPTGVPSTLLERRPDIAAAERQMASANAEIGIAESAFYPDLTLTASYGFTGFSLSKLVGAPYSLWSLGADIAQTVFDAGARSAQVDAARATYEQTVAGYRQTVLTGFQQVEDALAALRILQEQADAEARAVSAAQEAERLVLNQYRAGTVPYSSVLTAQTTSPTNQQTALAVAQSRLTSSVNLVAALGGGWDAAQLPSSNELATSAPPPAQ